MPRKKEETEVTPTPPPSIKPPEVVKDTVVVLSKLPNVFEVKHKKSGQTFKVNKDFYQKNQHNLEIV